MAAPESKRFPDEVSPAGTRRLCLRLAAAEARLSSEIPSSCGLTRARIDGGPGPAVASTPGGVETASQRFAVLEEVKPGSAGTPAQPAAVVAWETLNSGHEYRLNQIPKSFLQQFFATFGGHQGG
jgi:hypothetical protein